MSQGSVPPALLKRPTFFRVLVVSICGVLAVGALTSAVRDRSDRLGVSRIEGVVQAVSAGGGSVCILEKAGKNTCLAVQFAADEHLSQESRSHLKEGTSVIAYTVWVPADEGGSGETRSRHCNVPCDAK